MKLMWLLLASLFVCSTAKMGDYKKSILYILEHNLIADNKDLRPKHGAEPVEVEVDYYLQDIFDLDAAEQAVTISIYFRLFWTDDRIRTVLPALFNKSSHITLPSARINFFWTPDVFFPRARSVTQESEPNANEMMRLRSDGAALYSRRLMVRIPCEISTGYPMDSLNCSLDIESYRYSMEDMTFVFRRDAANYNRLDLGYGLFTLTKVVHVSTIEMLSTGRFQRLTVSLGLKRLVSHYVIQYYLPLICFITVAYLALWINSGAIFARFMVLLSVVILMAAHSIGIRMNHSGDHKVPYVTPMDVYGAFCHVMILLALLETAAVAVIDKRNLKDFSPMESTRLQPPDVEIKKQSIDRDRIGAYVLTYFDVTTRVAYVIIFTVFNLVYWLACAL